uniref:Glycine-rich cell wall structural protein 1 n=1 Tax=Steinernema glaseri TaxID=37863 RepID=A0A1I7ZCR4_9BILA
MSSRQNSRILSFVFLIVITQSAQGRHLKRSPDLNFLCKRQSGLAFCRGHEPLASPARAMAAPQVPKLRDDVDKPASPFDSASKNSVVEEASPFDTIATRAPISVSEHEKAIQKAAEEQHKKQQQGYYRPAVGGPLYNIYPILYPKGNDYCPQMKGMFAFTCQPSKPLRIDLVKFCQEYSAYCKVVNTHRLPGPGLGPPRDPSKGTGHVDINGHFGFGLGVLPGFEVGAGWGVDVGPIPGMGESVGVGVGADLGILGAGAPEKYRRGYDSAQDKKGGIFGISGGVGVDAPGAGPIGVGTGLGVGR